MEIIPDDPELIHQYMFMYSISSDGDEFDLILDDIEEPTYTQILLRLQAVNTFAISEIVDDTRQFIDANFYDELPMELTGGATLMGVVNHMVIRGQFVSLIVSVVIIFLLMTVCLGLLPVVFCYPAYGHICTNDVWPDGILRYYSEHHHIIDDMYISRSWSRLYCSFLVAP